MVADGADIRVAGDDGLRRRFQHVPGGLIGGVRDVGDDAQAVHLAHGLPSQAGQPAARVVLPGAVAERGATHPGEGEHAQAEAIEEAQRGKVLPERLRSLEGEERGDAALGGDALDVGEGQGELDLGAGRDLLEQRVDELHGAAQGAFRQKDGVDVDGADDEVDPAGAQTRQPFRAERSFAGRRTAASAAPAADRCGGRRNRSGASAADRHLESASTSDHRSHAQRARQIALSTPPR